jgi:rhodanese-related sulfurtransferase
MKHLTVEELVAFIDRHPRIQVLDVRFAFEREAGHMVGDHHVPWYTLDGDPNPGFLKQVLRRISPDDPVLVICHSGHRACEAAALLETAGFKHVYNMLGGYADILEMPTVDRFSAAMAATPVW